MRLGFRVHFNSLHHITNVVAATGQFAPETKVVTAGDGWAAIAEFGVGGGSVIVTEEEDLACLEIVFIPGSSGLRLRSVPSSHDDVSIPLWEMTPGRLHRITDRLDIRVQGRAEFADNELMGIYIIYVHGVAVFEVSQAIGEEYWGEFDQEVFGAC